MSIDDLMTFAEESPEVFDARPIPEDWTEDWVVIPVDDPEHAPPDGQEGELAPGVPPSPLSTADIGEMIESGDGIIDPVSADEALDRVREGGSAVDQQGAVGFPWLSPSFGPPFPGFPVATWSATETPPADALSFYLPYHDYFPDLWGIYLFGEGVAWLGRHLFTESNGQLCGRECESIARIYLYGHEAFHHSVESLATKLEISHHAIVYNTGFDRQFNLTFGTDACREEALAEAAGYEKLNAVLRDRRWPAHKRQMALDIILDFIKAGPPGYRVGAQIIGQSTTRDERAALSASYFYATFPSLPRKRAAIWNSFPHAYHGIVRVTSRVNYLIHRSSPYAQRIPARLF